MRDIRRTECPRADLFNEIASLRFGTFMGKPQSPGLDEIQAFNALINGPTSLKSSLEEFSRDQENLSNPDKIKQIEHIKELLLSEISRIFFTLIGSLIHPNTLGARRIAEVIERRWRSWHGVSVREELTKFLAPEQRANQPKTVSVVSVLRRFGLDPAAGLKACLAHSEPDVIGLSVRTSPTSAAVISGEVLLDLGVAGQPKLRHLPMERSLPALMEEHPHFRPGTSDFFTIDLAGQIAIGDISHAQILFDQGPNDAAWRPEAVTLSIDGRDVLTRSFDTPPAVGRILDLLFPG
jgi:hypothetical protein